MYTEQHSIPQDSSTDDDIPPSSVACTFILHGTVATSAARSSISLPWYSCTHNAVLCH